jgi:hypothetical protein
MVHGCEGFEVHGSRMTKSTSKIIWEEVGQTLQYQKKERKER